MINNTGENFAVRTEIIGRYNNVAFGVIARYNNKTMMEFNKGVDQFNQMLIDQDKKERDARNKRDPDASGNTIEEMMMKPMKHISEFVDILYIGKLRKDEKTNTYEPNDSNGRILIRKYGLHWEYFTRLREGYNKSYPQNDRIEIERRVGKIGAPVIVENEFSGWIVMGNLERALTSRHFNVTINNPGNRCLENDMLYVRSGKHKFIARSFNELLEIDNLNNCRFDQILVD